MAVGLIWKLDLSLSISLCPGMYVRQCLLEFKKLTFSQLMRFHASLQDFFKKEDDGTYSEIQTGYYEVCGSVVALVVAAVAMVVVTVAPLCYVSIIPDISC